MNNIIVTDFVSAFIANDKQGNRIEHSSRYAAALIFTKKGKVLFSSEGKEIISSPTCSIFIPEGLKYTNLCLEEAESIVINIRTLDCYCEPLQLQALPYETACEHYKKIKNLSIVQTEDSRCKIFEQIYSLLSKMLKKSNEEKDSINPFAKKALLYMNLHYEDPSLTIAEIAAECHISEIYLRKIFEKEFGIPPYKKLFEIRMNAAHLLAKEKRLVKEIAASTGYSDVFQFSRAYKRYFGYPPSET